MVIEASGVPWKIDEVLRCTLPRPIGQYTTRER
jgi:hypothetical protein